MTLEEMKNARAKIAKKTNRAWARWALAGWLEPLTGYKL